MAAQQHGDILGVGGPIDRSLLKHQEVHRSQAIWNAEIPNSTKVFDKEASLKVYRRTWKQKPVENAAFIEYMKAVGFWDVWCTGHVPIEAAVVTALVERWRPETHTFHMPVGEMTITLQDVAVLYGLPINGLPLTGDQTPTDWPEMCLTCFGRNPKSIPGGAIGNAIQLKWFEETYDPAELVDDAAGETNRQYVRASILRLIGCILFPKTTESRVNSCWVPMLLDFDSIASYSWGSACLAHLYHQLCRATNRDASVISGDLALLTMWAAERIVPLRFVVQNPVAQEYHQALGRR